MTSVLPSFLDMNDEEQFLTLMCPTTPQTAKIVNKFIKIIFEARERINDGHPPNEIYLNF